MYCAVYLVLLLLLFTDQYLVPTAATTVETKECFQGMCGQNLLSTRKSSSNEVKPSCEHSQLKNIPKYIVRYNKCKAKVLRCYCLTPTNTTIVNSTEVQYALGHCLYGCIITNRHNEYYLDNYWNSTLCSQYNRSRTLCGRCKDGYGPAVYSFSLRCVSCQHVSFWKQLLLYILVAYGPLTIFLVIIVLFSISVNSAPLHGWIFVSQIMACSFYVRVVTRMAELHHIDQYSYKIFATFYGIWNLDFFRTIYTPFCLHPNLTTLQVMSLDFIIAAYPLVAILLMYVLVDMYVRDCRPVVVMCRPFHFCCIRFRHRLNIKTSLVDAFGTFFSLSYVKIFSTVVDLLMPTKVWYENGVVSYHPYFDGTQLMFQSGHFPFALLSIFILIIFNILPLLLLLMYSIPKTHFCFKCLPRSVQNTLYPFMDSILSCYKDGLHGTSNCRYFAVVYPIARLVFFSSFMWTESVLFYSLAALVLIISGILVSLIRPYQSALYNAIDTFHLLCLAVGMVGSVSYMVAYIEDVQNKSTMLAIAFFPPFIHFFYVIFYLGYKCRAVLKHPLSFIVKMASKLKLLVYRRMRGIEDVIYMSESSSLIH